MSKEVEGKEVFSGTEAGRVLRSAREAIADHGDYGPPELNHQRIASLWNSYLESRFGLEHPLLFEPQDVAVMQILVKIARTIETPSHFDSWVDIAGYAAIAAEMKGEKDAE